MVQHSSLKKIEGSDTATQEYGIIAYYSEYKLNHYGLKVHRFLKRRLKVAPTHSLFQYKI